ncbi:MAG: glycoside hydrolase family 3 C-terminal domain-containing protein [Oscillospiraceae bacterium]|jgi:beta-glucosidase|nr:glycoside hydrolase family 3 C-terminal domain-containing protein [Oscillospiraceae bacterium]
MSKAPTIMVWGQFVSITHEWITPEGIASGELEARVTTGASADFADWLPAEVSETPFGPTASYRGELPPFFRLRAAVSLRGEVSETAEFVSSPRAPEPDYSPGAYLPEELPREIALSAPAGEIFFTAAAVPYSAGSFAPDSSAVSAVPEPRAFENAYTGKIALSDISSGAISGANAVVIKAIAAARDEGGEVFSSPVTTLFYAPDAAVQKLTPDNIDAVLAQMTAEEKLRLTGGIGGDPTVLINDGPAGATYGIPRLGIPPLVLADGPAGVRMRKNATVWLSPTGMASTWDLDLVREVGERVAAEATHYAVDVILAPGLNIQRNPLGGRNFEYYSEDPLITGAVGAAYINGVQSGGVGTSPKHFAGNDQENFRGRGNVIASERALREIFLRGFELVSKAQPWTYMCAYNAVNGALANENKWLMTDTLRKLWGWDGLMMSDWGADYDPAKSLEAQMDLGEPTRDINAALAWLRGETDAQANDTELRRRMALLDRSARNMLTLILKTHAYNGAYGRLMPDGSYAASGGVPGLTREIINNRSREFGGSEIQRESAAVNRRLATEGMVLLKNDGGALPIKTRGAKLSLVTSEVAWDELDNPGWYGNTASLGDIVTQGRGSAQVKFNGDGGSAWAPTLREGLTNGGFEIVAWKRDGEIAGTSDMPHGESLGADEGARVPARREDVEAAARAALDAGAEAFVFVVTRVSGEGQDVVPEEFALCAREESVFAPYADMFRAAGRRVIVLLNCGSAVDTTLLREKADAILDVFNPGTEGANAIADILSGRVSPSGKLTQTFPLTYDDSPSIAMARAEHRGKTFGTDPVYYDEGVYVGYRYFDTFGKRDRAAYPFGHGLSYTTFEFKNLCVSTENAASDGVTATLEITNTGDLPGRETAQLYIGADTYKSEGRPIKELRAFAKTKLLAPGETQTVTLYVPPRELCFYDDGNPDNALTERDISYTDGTHWRVAPGTRFNITVGNTSDPETLAVSGLSAEITLK